MQANVSGEELVRLLDQRSVERRSARYIPSEIGQYVHPGSGHIIQQSPYYHKTAYALFVSNANMEYLSRLVNRELEGLDIGCSIPEMVHRFRRSKRGTLEYDSIVPNPVLQLSDLNKEFLDYTIAAIKIRNHEPSARHAHQQRLLDYQNISDTHFQELNWGTRYRHLGDVNAKNVYRWGNRIPPDRVSMHQRHYERDITEALRDTRQLHTPIHGYDMSDLTNRSTSDAFNNNEPTAYRYEY